jgi:hypothetical protein
LESSSLIDHAMNTSALSLLAAAILFPIPLTAEIVGNLGSDSDSEIPLRSVGESAAQAFTTGSEAQYLASFTVRLTAFPAGGESTARIKLWRGAADRPEILVEDLGVTSPIEIFNDGEYSVLSTLQPLLAPNNRYWVSVTNTAGDFHWCNTSDTASTGTGSFVHVRAFSSSSSDGTWWPSGMPVNLQLLSILSQAPPAPIVVTNANTSGPGSLAQTIDDAPPGAIITFDTAVFNGEPQDTIPHRVLTIQRDVTIDARNIPAGVTLSGGGIEQLIYVKGSGINPIVTLHGLTLIEGEPNAIYNDSGVLTLTHCSLFGNIANNSGGAIYSFGPGSNLTLVHCTLSGNSSRFASGGAILADGPLTIRHCTISGNTAGHSGGGVTFNNNPFILENSIIAGNTATSFPSTADIYDQGDITFVGANIVQNISKTLSGSPGTTFDPGVINANPLLAPLANYGGSTSTMALRSGSPARNAAVGSTETADQRGLPIVGTADIGAYEAGNNLSSNRPIYLWESLPGTAPEASIAPEADFDGDGASNGDEWIALTDPSSSTSILRGTISHTGGDISITFPSATGRSYTLWQSETLIIGSFVDTGLPAILGDNANQSFTISIPNPQLYPRRFYTVQVKTP